MAKITDTIHFGKRFTTQQTMTLTAVAQLHMGGHATWRYTPIREENLYNVVWHTTSPRQIWPSILAIHAIHTFGASSWYPALADLNVDASPDLNREIDRLARLTLRRRSLSIRLGLRDDSFLADHSLLTPMERGVDLTQVLESEVAALSFDELAGDE